MLFVYRQWTWYLVLYLPFGLFETFANIYLIRSTLQPTVGICYIYYKVYLSQIFIKYLRGKVAELLSSTSKHSIQVQHHSDCSKCLTERPKSKKISLRRIMTKLFLLLTRLPIGPAPYRQMTVLVYGWNHGNKSHRQRRITLWRLQPNLNQGTDHPKSSQSFPPSWRNPITLFIEVCPI